MKNICILAIGTLYSAKFFWLYTVYITRRMTNIEFHNDRTSKWRTNTFDLSSSFLHLLTYPIYSKSLSRACLTTTIIYFSSFIPILISNHHLTVMSSSDSNLLKSACYYIILLGNRNLYMLQRVLPAFWKVSWEVYCILYTIIKNFNENGLQSVDKVHQSFFIVL